MLKTQSDLKQTSEPLVGKHHYWLPKIVPESILKFFILKLPFNKITKGSLNLNLFSQTYRFEGKFPGHHAEITILHPIRAYWLIKFQGELGFAQAYYEGAIDTNSLYALLYVGFDNREEFKALLAHKKLNFLQLIKHRKRHNSLQNSKRNISYHYDLGNRFYSLWLDKTMSYSSALFSNYNQTIEQAQLQKYQHLIDKLNIQTGHHVLEIGCGWGGFMEMAVKQGIQIKGLTLSVEQQTFALERLENLKSNTSSSSNHRIDLQDYRLEDGLYDHIVSIEMFEAVGREYWDQYFQVLNRCLKPNGKAGLQVITISEKQAEAYQNSVDFIQAYIFPGGLLPSVKQLEDLAERHGFEIELNLDFGKDYAYTCKHWKKQFNLQSQALNESGYDSHFQRLWNYYFDYCTIGFETEHISVNQLVLIKRDY